MIDDFDCRIIHHLTLDGRMSINELSERVNLSQTPVARRVKKLEDNKIITGYTALIDETRLAFQCLFQFGLKNRLTITLQSLNAGLAPCLR